MEATREESDYLKKIYTIVIVWSFYFVFGLFAHRLKSEYNQVSLFL